MLGPSRRVCAELEGYSLRIYLSLEGHGMLATRQSLPKPMVYLPMFCLFLRYCCEVHFVKCLDRLEKQTPDHS